MSAIPPTFTPDGSAMVFTRITRSGGYETTTPALVVLDGGDVTALPGTTDATHVRVRP